MKIGILLASGVGRRICDDLKLSNKCLMKVDNVSFLRNTVEQLLEVSDRVYISIGHNCMNIVEELSKSELDMSNVYYVFVEDFATTNNIISMKTVLDFIKADEVEVDTMFYAESDIYYSPVSRIFKNMETNMHGENVRCAIFSEEGKSEWYINLEEKLKIGSYDACERGGLSVIGAAMYNKEFFEAYAKAINDIALTNSQIYCDEAERTLLSKHHVYCYILDSIDILEVDTVEEFNAAKKQGFVLTV